MKISLVTPFLLLVTCCVHQVLGEDSPAITTSCIGILSFFYQIHSFIHNSSKAYTHVSLSLFLMIHIYDCYSEEKGRHGWRCNGKVYLTTHSYYS